MTRAARWLAWAGLGAVVAAYLIFSHFLAVDEHPNLVMLAVGVMPLAVMAVAVAWHSPLRWWALAAIGALALVVVVFIEGLRDHINWLYFVQHVGAMSLLALTFGSTLGRGDDNALCSRVTAMLLMHVADAAYMRYTWKVTVVWTVFFVLSAVVSVVLFFFGSLVVWSFFANLMTPVNVGLMFVVEYMVRIRVLPNRECFSIAQIVQAYRSYDSH